MLATIVLIGIPNAAKFYPPIFVGLANQLPIDAILGFMEGLGMVALGVLIGRIGFSQKDRITSLWRPVRKEPESQVAADLTDDELKEDLRKYAEMIARTIHNAQNQLTIDSDEPYSTARQQEEYVEEQIDRFKENSVHHADHSFEEIREAAKSRGIWNDEIDDLYENPTDLGDLRRLLILLEDVEAAIPSMGD